MDKPYIRIGHVKDLPYHEWNEYLEDGARLGQKKLIRKVLTKGVDVDHVNDEGQTALFVACHFGHENLVDYLLSIGAKPNERSDDGETPVHAACFAGDVNILMKLLQCKGDLRLHDYEGRSVKDWAMGQQSAEKCEAMIEFLEKCKLFAMSNAGQDLLKGNAPAGTLHKARKRKYSLTELIREKIGGRPRQNHLEKMATIHHSVGFGQVNNTGSDQTGFVSAIPIVEESALRPPRYPRVYSDGAFTQMSIWRWGYTDVTLRGQRRVDGYKGGAVDLLITEMDHIAQLRHPNVLSLMGVCQTSLDELMLIYEPVYKGSLFNELRIREARKETYPLKFIQALATQICSAIRFLHDRGFIHCSISSHAISVTPRSFKLGNFEYMTASSSASKRNPVTLNTYVYDWMAPELMFGERPTFRSDMYSYCMVLLEMFAGLEQFQCNETLRMYYSAERDVITRRMKSAEKVMPAYFRVALQQGLIQDRKYRIFSIHNLSDMLLAAPEEGSEYLKNVCELMKECERNVRQSQPSPS